MRTLRLCYFEGVDMEESRKVDLCRFGWMNFCVFLSEFRE